MYSPINPDWASSSFHTPASEGSAAMAVTWTKRSRTAALATAFVLLRHRDVDGFTGAAFGDPDGIARGLDGRRRFKPFPDHLHAGFVAIDSNHGNFACA